MSQQIKIDFKEPTGLKVVDWKLLGAITTTNKLESDLLHCKRSKGAYHSLYLQAKKEIEVLKEEIKGLIK